PTVARSGGRWAAVVAVVAMLAAGCSPTSTRQVVPPAAEPDGQESSEVPTDDVNGGTATVFGCPVQTLIPQHSRETCGGRIVAQVFSGLVELDAHSGQSELLVASSIETEDSQTWTITVSDGWTFHDGELVTGASFVDAWNFAADPANQMRNRDFFADIVGYDELADGEATRLRGLEIIDPMTIEVTLFEPFAPFFAKLSDAAFLPLPSIAYEDLDAFSRAPIGNGRFELVSFDPDREAVLRRYNDWAGAEPAHLREATFLIYAGNAAVETAYLDVRAGALDVLESIPPGYRLNVDDDFGDRVVRSPTSSFAFLGLPLYAPEFDDRLGLRQALSLAIDRRQIIDDILGGGMQPATGLIPPVLDAHRPHACQVCDFDPGLARALLADAGGWDGPLTLHHSTGGGAEAWLEAIAAYWRQELDITDIRFESMELASYLRVLEEREIHGPFSLRWSLSYLSPEYALSELFRTTGGANFFGYGNLEFDVALDEANAASPDDAIMLYQHAEDIVLADLPVIPLWYANTTTVHTARVENIIIDARGYLRVEQMRTVD
ncbi:MAG: ABC transporter substrate-binding protein, partial [Nitriliruptoraceae bacterium]